MKQLRIAKGMGGLLLGLFLFFTCNLQAKSNLLLQEANKESLKDTKSLKSPIKLKDKETKATSTKAKAVAKSVGGTYPYDTFTIDSTTDALSLLKDSNGNPIVYVVSTKGADINYGDNVAFDHGKLDDPKKYYVQKYDTKTKKLVGEYINARAYYNGGHNFNAEYNEWGMPHSNSFGLWIKLTQYPKTDLTLFSRNEKIEKPNGYRTDYFHFQLLTQGLLRVSSKITDYSVDSLTTQKPLPLNKWVYIQAIQNGVNYQIGWKSREGSENELVSKAFSRDTLKMHDNQSEDSPQKSRVFNTNKLEQYANGSETLTIREGFYNPDIRMFEMIDKYDTKEKLISTIYAAIEDGKYIVYPLSILSREAYAILLGGQSSILTRNDFDIYYDANTLNVIVIDFRNNRKGAWQ